MNDQENFGGTCYNSAGTSKINCPAQPTYSPGPTTSSCSQSLINLLGSGCHWMYSDSSGRGIYCDGPMSKSAKEGDTATKAGCNPEGRTYSPYPSYSPGTSYTPYPTCPSGQWWDTATSSCKTTSTTDCTSGYYWDSASNMCKPNSTASYTPPPSCPSDQWWDYTTSSCKSSTSTYSPYPTYTPYSGYCGDNVCSSSETSTSCSSDCGSGGGTTYTPYPTTTTSTYTPPPSCSSDQYWNGSFCVANPTPYPTTEYTPPPTYSEPPPTYSEPPPPTSSLYPHYIVAHCQQLGRTWNGKTCQANGLFARFFEGSGMANALRLFYIIP
jgi:hypothetical protein